MDDDLQQLRSAERYTGRRVSAEVGFVDNELGQSARPTPAQNALERLIALHGREVGAILLREVGSAGCTAAGQALAIVGLLDSGLPEVIPALQRVAATDANQANQPLFHCSSPHAHYWVC